MFGNFLRGTLEGCGVETKGLSLVSGTATSLALCAAQRDRGPGFQLYRNPGADTRLDLTRQTSLLDECRLLCFGSPAADSRALLPSVAKFVDYARQQGKLTAYDPNWRPPLWQDKDEGIRQMRSLVGKADIMKVSDEELALLTGLSGMEEGAKALLSQGVSPVVVTLGASGCAVFTPEFFLRRNTYDTKVKDTTGSGDSFFGALLAKIVQSGKKAR